MTGLDVDIRDEAIGEAESKVEGRENVKDCKNN
jgi:hypothetical protein